MDKNNSFVLNLCIEFLEYIRSVVAPYVMEDTENYPEIKKDLDVLENRIDDETLYLGVIGSFSSGKSTFINSLIHKNLLPTDAVQGTTVTTSILKRANFDDLKITYLNNTEKLFSQCANELLLKYQIQNSCTNLANKISIWQKIINWIKRLLGIHVSPKIKYEDRVALFKKLISTEDMAQDVKCVTLYYQNDNLPHSIALVDTPGTESLNKRHNDVTKDAIHNICDAVVVIIPYDEPVSEELLNYIDSNLEVQKEDCIFVITKVELLGDKEELPRLIRVIKKRLENGLGIKEPCVLPMPTLIYLKSVDPDMKTTFLDEIPESEKYELLQMYEDGLHVINKLLESKRIEYIKKKILTICKRINLKLSLNLMNLLDDFDEKNRQLQCKSVKPIVYFEGKANADMKELIDSYQKRVNARLPFVKTYFSEFYSEIKETLDACSDSQTLYNHIYNFSISPVFEKINEYATEQLLESQGAINSKLHVLQNQFKMDYSQCGAKCVIEDIYIVNKHICSERFISECELEFQKCIEGIKNLIKSDTSGILKKVKAFFSNPYNKHKEFAISELADTVETLSRITEKHFLDHLTMALTQAGSDAEDSIKNMLTYDKAVIENYINKMNQSFECNNKNIEAIKLCMKQLDTYMSKIKESV